MENHVLCYVKRSLITKWKRLILTRDSPLFVYGSNDDRVFAARLRNGGILWVIASIPSRPPELVARLDVEFVRKRDDPELGINPHFCQEFPFKWLAKGKSSSEFFGHNNAESALLQSVFQPKNGKPWKIDEVADQWQGKFGQKLQSPRLICEAGIFEEGIVSSGSQPFYDLQMKKRRAIFLSWKWRDNTKKFMRELAYELVVQGFMPWLDLLAMPWSLELSNREEEKPKLGRLLKYGYRQAAAVVAIDSENYGTATDNYPNWTKREWDGKLATGEKPKVVYRPRGQKPSKLIQNSKDEFPVFDQVPAQFAKKLRDWFDENIDP